MSQIKTGAGPPAPQHCQGLGWGGFPWVSWVISDVPGGQRCMAKVRSQADLAGAVVPTLGAPKLSSETQQIWFVAGKQSAGP